jgi:hypothetical protein
MFSLSEKSQSLVVLLYVVMKVGRSFTPPENCERSMPTTFRAKSLQPSLRCGSPATIDSGRGLLTVIIEFCDVCTLSNDLVDWTSSLEPL